MSLKQNSSKAAVNCAFPLHALCAAAFLSKMKVRTYSGDSKVGMLFV